VLPFSGFIEGSVFEGSFYDVFLKPYFDQTYRPVHTGDTFMARVGTGHTRRAMELKVVETYPAEYCIVAPETEIICQYGEPLRREAEEGRKEVRQPPRSTYRSTAVLTNAARAASLRAARCPPARRATPWPWQQAPRVRRPRRWPACPSPRLAAHRHRARRRGAAGWRPRPPSR
jgi:hypothetical protein